MACCYCNHRPVRRSSALIDEHDIRADELSRRNRLRRGSDEALGGADPQTGLEGKFSMEYVAAATSSIASSRLRLARPMVQRQDARRDRKGAALPRRRENSYSSKSAHDRRDHHARAFRSRRRVRDRRVGRDSAEVGEIHRLCSRVLGTPVHTRCTSCSRAAIIEGRACLMRATMQSRRTPRLCRGRICLASRYFMRKTYKHAWSGR